MSVSASRKAIRAKLVDILTNETDAGERVYPSRAIPVWESELPAIAIHTPGSTREIDSQPKRYRVEQTVRIEVYHKKTSYLDDDLDDLAGQVEYALAQDFTLGDLVEECEIVSDEVTIDHDGDALIGSVVLTLRCVFYADEVRDPKYLDDLETVDTVWEPGGSVSGSPETRDMVSGLST